jgi:uncharacterized membrane protein
MMLTVRCLLVSLYRVHIWQAFGQTTYLITTFKLVPAGTEGAVSLEGTVAGTW